MQIFGTTFDSLKENAAYYFILYSIFLGICVSMYYPQERAFKDEIVGNIWVISDIGYGRFGLIKYIVWLANAIFVMYLFLMLLVVVLNVPLWAKVLSEAGYIIFILYALTIRTSILNKNDNTVTVNMRLFGYLTVYHRVATLSDFYGIRVRGDYPGYQVRTDPMIFELVGSQGTTLRLKRFRYSNESSRKVINKMRDSVAAWANKKVMYDQFYPYEEQPA